MARTTPITIIVLSLVTVLALSLYFSLFSNRWERRSTFVRPDGRYQVVVMRQRPLLAAMPGQAGDAPGEILIQDQSGNILHRKMVTMVQTVDEVVWSTRKVSVKLQGEWPLPD